MIKIKKTFQYVGVGLMIGLCTYSQKMVAQVQPKQEEVKQETFAVGKNTFLLNGKPTVIKAAEIHYPRIPEPYWEQRIEMCKSLGMNTICIYIFWNLHEQKPDEFDFTGNKDLAKFCRLAQKHGMYVIVRPGPYVCAEWEMGGLPWWLLKKKDITVTQVAYTVGFSSQTHFSSAFKKMYGISPTEYKEAKEE